MNVSCPECGSIFRIDPARVPSGGVRARCAICGGVISVEAPDAFFGADAERAQPALAGGSGWRSGAATATPAGSITHGSPPTPTSTIAAPGWEPPRTPPMSPAVDQDAAAPPGTPTPAAASPAVTPAPGGAPPRPVGGSTRPINPFLSNDPNVKARRLARALVSDIVAYHPQLREQGLRDGTLKQLLHDEIKKSYEEYMEQVGREFAEGTSHFQDALNEILAAGRAMF